MTSNHDPLFWFVAAKDSLAFAVTAGTGIFVWYRTRGSRYWPMTYGKIEYAMTSDTNGWKSNLVYSYKVGNDFYSGVYPVAARNETHADELAAKWKGQSVAVRYSRGIQPSRSFVKRTSPPSRSANLATGRPANCYSHDFSNLDSLRSQGAPSLVISITVASSQSLSVEVGL